MSRFAANKRRAVAYFISIRWSRVGRSGNRWLTLTHLLVAVLVAGDRQSRLDGRAGRQGDGRGTGAAVRLGGRAELVGVGTRNERHPG